MPRHTTPGDLLSCQNTQQQSSAYLLPAPRCRGGVKESCNFWETESGCRGCLVLAGAAWPRLLETFHSSAFIRQLPVTDTPGAGAGDPHGAGTKYHTLLFLSNNNIKLRAIDKFNIIEPKCAGRKCSALDALQSVLFLMQPFLRWRSLKHTFIQTSSADSAVAEGGWVVMVEVTHYMQQVRGRGGAGAGAGQGRPGDPLPCSTLH